MRRNPSRSSNSGDWEGAVAVDIGRRARRQRAGLVGLIEDIGKGPVALDTVAFIYLIEEHPRFLRVIEAVFTAIDTGRLRAVTSSLTLLEVLAVPYRAGDQALADRYERILTHGRGLELPKSIMRSFVLRRIYGPCIVRSELRMPCRSQQRSLPAARRFSRTIGICPPIPGLAVRQVRDCSGR